MTQSYRGTKIRSVRAPDEVWLPALERAEAEGTSLSAVIVAFLREYGAPRPKPRRRRTAPS